MNQQLMNRQPNEGNIIYKFMKTKFVLNLTKILFYHLFIQSKNYIIMVLKHLSFG
jgi:hypothetical protein